jgi:hypothetical protein
MFVVIMYLACTVYVCADGILYVMYFFTQDVNVAFFLL